MQGWQEDQIQALLTIQSERELFEALIPIARDFGFDFCAYGIRMPVPLAQPKVVMFSNYPAAWRDQYQERNYFQSDPTVQHGICSMLPVVWTDNLFHSARELWENAHSYGLRFGWAQSSRDVNGVGGMLTLARSHEPLTHLELRQKQLRMAWFTQVAHYGMSSLLTATLLPESGSRLTDREAAVLRWAADGKTSEQTADILGISERTVNFHINNAAAKLGANNKLSAAVRAAVLGQL